MRTLDTFYAYDNSIKLILVLPGDHQSYWKQLCHEYQFSVPHRIANGGATRFHSVQNGLSLVDAAEALVAVHDGVRPFVSTEVISNCYSTAQQHGTAIPVIDVFETVRHIECYGNCGEKAEQTLANAQSVTVPRSEYKLVQTPQVFDAQLLRQAYNQPFSDMFTDDASVVEAYGHNITLTRFNCINSFIVLFVFRDRYFHNTHNQNHKNNCKHYRE
jgi:2-C-methyl-D-erythritol 4-phosphate cytidylyltransferase